VKVRVRFAGSVAIAVALLVSACVPATQHAREPGTSVPARDSFKLAWPGAPAAPTGGATVLVPVFCYHHVLPKAPNSIAVTPATFEAQLKVLRAAGFVAVTPERLDAALSGEGTLPAKPVMITFDDGWRNQFTYAAPLLKKYGFTAVFFVYPQLIWSKASVFMSSADVKALSDAGFSIESHTWSHADLRRKRGESSSAFARRVRGELDRSKRWIEAVTGRPAMALAYPYGLYDTSDPSVLEASGYRLAFTTDEHDVAVPGSDRYALARFPITRGLSLAGFRAQAESGLLDVTTTTPSPGAHVSAARPRVAAQLASVPASPVVFKIDYEVTPARIETTDAATWIVAAPRKPLDHGFHWVTLVSTDANGRRLYSAWGFSTP
jgi:peptidoglycan/xylan/chitin deacetylase (PgdA/CDA1 family)